MASNRCKEFIKNAIEDEEVKVVIDDVKHSSSVVDAAYFLWYLFKVRDDLEWPVTVEMMEFTIMIMKEMTDTGLLYVIDVFMKLKEEYLFDEEGQFRASPEVSESRNNSLAGLCDLICSYVLVPCIFQCKSDFSWSF